MMTFHIEDARECKRRGTVFFSTCIYDRYIRTGNFTVLTEQYSTSNLLSYMFFQFFMHYSTVQYTYSIRSVQ